jgi:hypothetical protein
LLGLAAPLLHDASLVKDLVGLSGIVHDHVLSPGSASFRVARLALITNPGTTRLKVLQAIRTDRHKVKILTSGAFRIKLISTMPDSVLSSTHFEAIVLASARSNGSAAGGSGVAAGRAFAFRGSADGLAVGS